MEDNEYIDRKSMCFDGRKVPAGTVIPAGYVCTNCHQLAAHCKCHMQQAEEQLKVSEEREEPQYIDAVKVTARISVTFAVPNAQGGFDMHAAETVYPSEDNSAPVVALATLLQYCKERFGVNILRGTG